MPQSEDFLALGEAIREVRRKAGLSQEQLALNASVDRAFVSALERGQRNVTLVNILKICRALDERPSSLFKRWERSIRWKA